MMLVSMYPPQWWNTTVHPSGLPDLPMLPGRDCVPPHPTCPASHGTRCHTLQDDKATSHSAQVITDFLLHALQIWLLSVFDKE